MIMDMSDIKLRNMLKLNALFSLINIGLLISVPDSLATFMGIDNSSILFYIGIILILFVALVIYTAYRPTLNKMLVYSIIIQDMIWVIASLILIMWNPFHISIAGNILIGAVAFVVCTLAICQFKYSQGVV